MEICNIYSHRADAGGYSARRGCGGAENIEKERKGGGGWGFTGAGRVLEFTVRGVRRRSSSSSSSDRRGGGGGGGAWRCVMDPGTPIKLNTGRHNDGHASKSCHGGGSRPSTHEETCPACGLTGKLRYPPGPLPDLPPPSRLPLLGRRRLRSRQAWDHQPSSFSNGIRLFNDDRSNILVPVPVPLPIRPRIRLPYPPPPPAAARNHAAPGGGASSAQALASSRRPASARPPARPWRPRRPFPDRPPVSIFQSPPPLLNSPPPPAPRSTFTSASASTSTSTSRSPPPPPPLIFTAPFSRFSPTSSLSLFPPPPLHDSSDSGNSNTISSGPPQTTDSQDSAVAYSTDSSSSSCNGLRVSELGHSEGDDEDEEEQEQEEEEEEEEEGGGFDDGDDRGDGDGNGDSDVNGNGGSEDFESEKEEGHDGGGGVGAICPRPSSCPPRVTCRVDYVHQDYALDFKLPRRDPAPYGGGGGGHEIGGGGESVQWGGKSATGGPHTKFMSIDCYNPKAPDENYRFHIDVVRTSARGYGINILQCPPKRRLQCPPPPHLYNNNGPHHHPSTTAAHGGSPAGKTGTAARTQPADRPPLAPVPLRPNNDPSDLDEVRISSAGASSGDDEDDDHRAWDDDCNCNVPCGALHCKAK